jgi:hypothetical protein
VISNQSSEAAASLDCRSINALLAPVTLNKNPPTAAVYPGIRHPNRAGTRRTYPVAGHPDIARSVPAVIAGDPDESRLRRRPVTFYYGRRRADLHVNLRERRSRKQSECQQGSEQNLSHKRVTLQPRQTSASGSVPAVCRFQRRFAQLGTNSGIHHRCRPYIVDEPKSRFHINENSPT